MVYSMVIPQVTYGITKNREPRPNDSDENSILLGNDSDGWVCQEEDVVTRFDLLNAKEKQEASEALDDAGTIHEWELDMLERDNSQKEDVQEGSPNEEEEFKTVEVVIGTFTVERLNASARQCSVPVCGKKHLLLVHI